MAKFIVTVEQDIAVELDETKFDEAFMREFRESFFAFETLDQHAKHIGQLVARGIVDGNRGSEFIEGYGRAGDMGIKASAHSSDEYVVPA